MDLLYASPFFQGDVTAAVQKALSSNLILAVVIVAPNSTADDAMWQDAVLAEKLRTECVALRLSVGSAAQEQFSLIYGPVGPLPSLYLVSSTGTLLKVIQVSDAQAVLQALRAVGSDAVAALKQRAEALRVQRAEEEKKNETGMLTAIP